MIASLLKGTPASSARALLMNIKLTDVVGGELTGSLLPFHPQLAKKSVDSFGILASPLGSLSFGILAISLIPIVILFSEHFPLLRVISCAQLPDEIWFGLAIGTANFGDAGFASSKNPVASVSIKFRDFLLRAASAAGLLGIRIVQLCLFGSKVFMKAAARAETVAAAFIKAPAELAVLTKDVWHSYVIVSIPANNTQFNCL